ncbi:MAG: cytochrome C oxidase subunit IV family protein [Planctomycetes bacterium]|nr:cytochrome C oxidase subunit IV family protein [Planctomycetota bacterium]
MTNDTGPTSAPSTAPATPHYGVYFRIWGVLLVITLLMVLTHNPAILLPGMAAKATLIALWFMHLKDERKDFIFYIASSIVILSLILFALMVPDGKAM